MRLMITILLLFAGCLQAQTYTFSKVDCRMEVYEGASLEYNLELATTTWADISPILLEIKDGVTSISVYNTQIANNDGSIDSLKLDLTSWTNICAGATATEIYWEAGTTGISPKGDSTLIFEDGSGTIGNIITNTADSSHTVGVASISGSTLSGKLYGGKSFIGIGTTAIGTVLEDDLTAFANFDKLTHFDALGNWTSLGFNTTTHLSATGDFVGASGWYMNSYQIDTTNGTAAVKNHLRTALGGADMAVVEAVESTTGKSHHTTLVESNDTNTVKIENYVEFSPTNATRGLRQSWWGNTIFKGAVNQYTFPYAKGTAGDVFRLSHTTADTLEFVDMVNVASLDSLTATITESAFTDVVSYTNLTLGGQTIAIPESPTDGWVVIITDGGANFSTRNCTVDPTGTTTINGSLTYVMDANKEAVTLTFDGSNYIITGAYLE